MSDGNFSNIGKRLGDTSDLPQELKRLLSSTRLDDVEEKIYETMKNRYDGVASVDEVLVGLYRDYQYIPTDRKTVSNKLYRMTKSGHLESVPKRKGVFKIK